MAATITDATARTRTRARHQGKLALLAIWPTGRGQVFALPDRGRICIGRAVGCDIQIGDDSVSRNHAVLRLDSQITLEDLGSRNGTRLRGTPLTPRAPIPIQPGDAFELGDLLFTLQMRQTESTVGEQQPRSPTASMIQKVAKGHISVLIIGETGAGKDVLARSVHMGSPRAARPFLRLNCAALSESLIESELFGHEKGAFTGAVSTKLGLIETAEGGSVFLDEIRRSSVVLASQVASRHRAAGVLPRRRVAAEPSTFASSQRPRDLEVEVERGTFRRVSLSIAGVLLRVPPLRERKGEIIAFANEFLADAAAESGATPPQLTDDATAWLTSHAWPGNLRELRNMMERALLFAGGGAIGVEHLAQRLASGGRKEPDERQRIVDALAQFAGNQSGAAAFSESPATRSSPASDSSAWRRPRKLITARRSRWRPTASNSVSAWARAAWGSYSAWDCERRMMVVLKTSFDLTPEALVRFKAEFRTLQDVHHPNLVGLGELIHDRPRWFFTMELVSGVDFLKWVRPGNALNERRLRSALAQLCVGIDVIHAMDKVHCDIKPSNVLVTAEGRVVVLDFGLLSDWRTIDAAEATAGSFGVHGTRAAPRRRDDWSL